MKNTAKMDLFLILKNIRENVPNGHFEEEKRKKEVSSFLLKKKTGR